MGGVNDEEEGMLKWCGNDNNDKDDPLRVRMREVRSDPLQF